jgi:membrane peptidoglycan carboxypeptidase
MHLPVRPLLLLPVALVTAGALVATVAAPWVLGPGLAVAQVGRRYSAIDTDADLTPALHGNTRVLTADGRLITEFYRRDRQPVTGDHIAPVMRKALVDIEDARFYEHGPIDVTGTLRALLADVRSGGVVQGGSTLTQQLVKQTLLQEATTPSQRREATADTLTRKLTEARLAAKLENKLSKDEILTRYLNTVYFGHGAYGVEAAAHVYFSTDAAHLTLPEAATLAGLVQNPTGDDPITHPDAARARRAVVLQRMADLGDISSATLAATTDQPLGLRPGGLPPRGCAPAHIGAFFCRYVINYLTGTLGLTSREIETGGLTIRTTLDAELQHAGDRAVIGVLPKSSPLAGMFTVVRPGTGEVLAMSVNRTFGCRGTGCTSIVLNDAAAAGAGSTYKVFTAAYALQHGYRMDFTQTTSDPYVSRVFKQQGGTKGDPYTVSNAGHYPPTLNMAQALVMSSNTYFLALEDHLGAITGPVRTAQRMGLFSLGDEEARTLIADRAGSFTLGTIPTDPLALADAYATVFSGGTRCDPTPVTAVLGPDGKPLTDADGAVLDTGTHCSPHVLPPGVAHTRAQGMRGDVESDIGTAARADILGHEIAGKTGTAQNNYSVAFVGSTPEYTASVMVENPVRHQDVGGFGGDKGAQIWHDAMLPILSGHPSGHFPPADPRYLGGLAQTSATGCTFTIGNLRLPCS